MRKLRVQAVARLARFSVADPIRQHDEKLRRIKRLTRTKKFAGKFRPRSEGSKVQSVPLSEAKGPKSGSGDPVGAVREPPLRSQDPGLRVAAAPDSPTPFTIQSTHFHKGQLLLKLEGVESANDAEALRGYWVLVPLEDAHKLPRGAYFIYQIVGLEVFTEAGDLLGKVADVLTTSANDVYVVKGPGVQEPSGELLKAVPPVTSPRSLLAASNASTV